MNKAIIMGRLGKDPETKSIQGGILCNLNIATSESFKGRDGEKQEVTDWHNVVVFGKLAEICAKHLSKGSKVLVEGKMKTRSWQAEDGSTRYRHEINAQTVIFLDAPKKPAEQEGYDEIPF